MSSELSIVNPSGSGETGYEAQELVKQYDTLHQFESTSAPGPLLPTPEHSDVPVPSPQSVAASTEPVVPVSVVDATNSIPSTSTLPPITMPTVDAALSALVAVTEVAHVVDGEATRVNGGEMNGHVSEHPQLLAPVSHSEAIAIAATIPPIELASISPAPPATPSLETLPTEPPASMIPTPIPAAVASSASSAYLPPPPALPLPSHLEPSRLDRVDSASSLIVEPPTPHISPPQVVVAPSFTPAVPSPYVSPIPSSSYTMPTPLTESVAATPVLQPHHFQVQQQDTVMHEIASVSPVNKRSAPEEGVIGESSEEDREAKRQRVETAEASASSLPLPIAADPVASTSAATLPFLSTYNTTAFSTPSEIDTPVLASPYTIAPHDLLHQYSTAGAPALGSVPAAAYALPPAPQEQPAAIAAPVVADGPVAAMNKEQHKFAISLLRTLKKHRSAAPFMKPVDPVALAIPDYFRVITQPTDITTIEGKVNATGKAIGAATKSGRTFGIDYTGSGNWEGQSPNVYRTATEFREEVERVWGNCFKYNGPKEKNVISAMAAALEETCERMWRNMPPASIKPQPVARQLSPAPEVKKERRASNQVAAPARRTDDVPRPKREIHAPARDIPEGGGRRSRISGKGAQEQLKYCKEVIKEMYKKIHEPYAFVFYNPVDYVALNIPTYPDVVRHPMDLGTIRNKLESGAYPVPPYAAFEADMRLVFHNCYIFNPPGTPVNLWGKQSQAVFEEKWSVRPTGEDEEEQSDDEIAVLERQISDMQNRIDHIRSDRANAKAAAKRAAQLARPPKPPPVKKEPQVKPPRRKSTTNGGGGGGSAGPTLKKKHKVDRDVSEDVEETVTFEMKRELAVKISAFEGDNLERAIDIIRMGRPDLLSEENKEIELDIDQLDQRTLLSLYRFVCPPQKAPPRGRKPKTDSTSGALKRKNMDETKESQRIEMLEARLRDFEGAGGEASRRGSGIMGGGGGGGGESSSGSSSDGSDSESDGSD